MALQEEEIGINEAARRLRVHPNTVRNWIASGKLKARPMVGGSGFRRIPVSEVERLEPRGFEVGDVLVWESDNPHARCVVRVTAINDNGEERWYETEDVSDGRRALNEESRMFEACVHYADWRERPL